MNGMPCHPYQLKIVWNATDFKNIIISDEFPYAVAQGVWLGANDLEAEGHYKYVDSTVSMTFTNWDGFHEGIDASDCVRLYQGTDFAMGDWDCNHVQYMVMFCEIDPIK